MTCLLVLRDFYKAEKSSISQHISKVILLYTTLCRTTLLLYIHSANGWTRVWIGMTGGMAKYWIIPRVGDKELPCVGHQLASCSLLILMFLCSIKFNKEKTILFIN